MLPLTYAQTRCGFPYSLAAVNAHAPPAQDHAAGVRFNSELTSWLHAHGRDPEPPKLPEALTGLLGRLYRDENTSSSTGITGGGDMVAPASDSGCASPGGAPMVVAGVEVDRRHLEEILLRQVLLGDWQFRMWITVWIRQSATVVPILKYTLQGTVGHCRAL